MESLSDMLRKLSVECTESDANITPIPESYIWSQDDRPVELAGIPVIDLHGLRNLDEETEKHIIQELALACENGFFQVINHGMSSQLLENMELQGRRLFSLPTEQKVKAQRTPHGVSGYGVARISSFHEKQMWCEGFTCVGSALEHAKKLWPEDHQQFCDTKDEYERELKQVAIKMMSLVGKTLGITKWSDELHSDEAFGIFQMNYYPPCPEPLKTVGLAAHKDSHFLTLVYQGDVEGVHYLNNGKWISVPIVPNALVVSFGDLFEILSNGRYKSPLHRALPNKSRSRISVVYFWGPPYASVIKPAPELVDSEHPPLYKSVSRNEYLREKGVRFGDALPFFRTEQSQVLEERN